MNADRPTRELVEAALARVGSPRVMLSSRDVLAAEVRALRADLDAAHVASEQIAAWRNAQQAELERLQARLARWEATDSRDEWGARHLDDASVKAFGGHEHGARTYVRASITRPAVLVRREVRTGPWTEVSA